MIIVSSSMIRMTWIRVEGVGVLRSFLFIFLPSFLASFLSPSFLPSFLPLFLSSLAFLPSLRCSHFVPSYLSSFLSCFLVFSFPPSSRHSFLPSFIAFDGSAPAKKVPKQKKDRKNTPCTRILQICVYNIYIYMYICMHTLCM